ncbi:hypothetical protein ACWGH8_35270 [Nonomuraea muscovyensis]|uniref:Uncharacterized protein n=1 Tax=Nonomuraea muscovyensis TaxID=1124761 RepID=A0A7X0C727_9ACTN|nr:hypothetical protein [Nonomuraea muscovyensis]MBB6348311.1 hypothetical protein [Nonomuraea muscovyensis]
MRRRPSICDACARLRQRANPQAVSSIERYVPYCEAFPREVPEEIVFGGFDHRRPYPGDGGIRFEPRAGGESALAAYEREGRPPAGG